MQKLVNPQYELFYKMMIEISLAAENKNNI
jgi:hypothetical protein